MKKLIYIFVLVLIFHCTLSIENCFSQWQTDVRLTNNPAESFTSCNNERCVGTSGNTVHIVWYDYRDGNYEIYYKRSTDGGLNWGADIRLTNNSADSDQPSIFVSGAVVNIVWCDRRDGNGEIYFKRSTDGGTTWGTDTRLTNNSYSSAYPSVSVSGQFVHVVWFDNRDVINWEIYYKRSTDGGLTWGAETRLTYDQEDSGHPSISASGSDVHVAWYDRRNGNYEIYYKHSTDAGYSWGADTRLTNNSAESTFPSIAVSGSILNVVWLDYRDGNYEIYYKRSTDAGYNWGADTRLTNNAAASMYPSIAVLGLDLHVVWLDSRDGNYEIYYKRSIDGGSNWEPDVRLTNASDTSWYPSVSASGTTVHVVWYDKRDGNNEIYYKRNPTGNSTTVGWVKKSNGLPANVSTNSFIALGTNLFLATANYGAYLSTNNGDNWISYSNGLPNNIYEFAVIGNILFAATGNYGVYKSTNNGANWTQVNSGLTDVQVLRLAVKGTDLYAGTYDYGIFKTTNNGDNWTNCLNTSRVYSLDVIGNDIFAGTHYSGSFRSTNNGLNWVGINNGISFPVFGGFTSIGNNLFAGTRNGGGVYLSTNNGNNWNPVNNGLIYNDLIYVISKDSTLFAGSTGSGGVFISTNKGGNWVTMNQGFDTIPAIVGHAINIINNYIFVGTNIGIWRRDLSASIGIKNISTKIPTQYSLEQNYPNPFNPVTKIRFTIPARSPIGTFGDDRVVLKVYDVTGREVQTLVNESLKPGTYETSFDGSSLNSGVYFYKMITDDFTETKKMLMIK